MRVLHIFYEINFSGAEIMYADAAPIFQKSGIELIALATGNKVGNFVEQFKAADIRIIHKPIPSPVKTPFGFLGHFKDVYFLLKEEKIDVLHLHRSGYFLFYSICGYLAGVRTISTLHNVFKNKKMFWWKGWLLRKLTRVLGTTFQSISESVYQNELKYYKNPSAKIFNWYNSSRFYPPVDQTEKNRLRQKFDIDQDAYVIISAGSCSHIKNHADIIRALSFIDKQFHCIYLHLGTGSVEHEEHVLADTLGVTNNIRFLGNKVNVRDYLIASDTFVMTSKYEGIGIAAIEAMACQLPVIFYNVPGLWDLIHQDDTGFLIPLSPQILAEKITILKDSPELSMEKGMKAHAFVTQYFSIDRNVPKIIQLYSNG